MMLRTLYGDQLADDSLLRGTMFRDRARQFRDRLGWPVRVDCHGHERDEYDALNPIYLIWQHADGRHGGSMRFLPTVGRTMVNDHFSHVIGGVHLASPVIWECTRFCLAPQSHGRTTAALVLGVGLLMERFSLAHLVAVFDRRMERIYRMLGVNPEILGATGEGLDQICVGLWDFDSGAKPRIQRMAGVTEADIDDWRAFAFQTQAKEREPEPA